MDEQAEDMFSRLVKEYADRQEVTEQLKAENQILWVQKMNNIQACVREVVERENLFIGGGRRFYGIWECRRSLNKSSLGN